MNYALVFLLSSLTKLGMNFLSLARQRIAEEVASLNDPNVVKSTVPNPDGSVLVTLLPEGATEAVAVMITPAQIAGLAKTQKIINKLAGLFPINANPFLSQLIRAIIEITLLGARAAEARKIPQAPESGIPN